MQVYTKITDFFQTFYLNIRWSIFLVLGLWAGCFPSVSLQQIPQWTTYEITLKSGTTYDNPYTDVEVVAIFSNPDGQQMIRPAFWDGGNQWKVRFAPPDAASAWTWKTECSDNSNSGLHNQTGSFQATAYAGNNELLRHGLLQMSPGKRNVIHKDGNPFLVVGDTPWAFPFRATTDQARIYAADRQAKGFNTALLMSVQPDMEAEGPEARNTPQGFMRGLSAIFMKAISINSILPIINTWTL